MNSLSNGFPEKLILILTSSILCLTPLVLSVSDFAVADEGQLSLSVLVHELVARSPEIKAARQHWESAKAVVPQVQTLPDPRLQLGYQRMPMVPPVVEGVMYGVGQEIPFPGKLKLEGRSSPT